MASDPRLLLVPVSGPRGMGEYARCLAIAQAVQERWPGVEPRFLVSREAPYAATCPFPATLLPSSPTRCTPQVLAEIEAVRPAVVVFDNAGRTRQVAAARLERNVAQHLGPAIGGGDAVKPNGQASGAGTALSRREHR